MEIGFPERASTIRRAAGLLCVRLAWAPVHEVPLANGRRADILALRPDGGFACIEVKSGARDFLADRKWPEYLDFSDALYFAVDVDFPLDLLPETVGVIVAESGEAEVFREAPDRKLPAARRRAVLHRFAALAATRLAVLQDPIGATSLRRRCGVSDANRCSRHSSRSGPPWVKPLQLEFRQRFQPRGIAARFQSGR